MKTAHHDDGADDRAVTPENFLPLRISADARSIKLVEMVITQLETRLHHAAFCPFIPAAQKKKGLANKCPLIDKIDASQHGQNILRPFKKGTTWMMHEQGPTTIAAASSVVEIRHHRRKHRYAAC